MRKRMLPLLCFALLWALLFSACLSVRAEEDTTDVLEGSVPFLVNKDHPVAEDFVPADLWSTARTWRQLAIRLFIQFSIGEGGHRFIFVLYQKTSRFRVIVLSAFRIIV